MDPYAVLGVGRSATNAEIRDAYLRRSKQLHPDRLVDATDAQRAAATRALQDVTAAYAELRHRDEPSAQQAPPYEAPAYQAPAYRAPAWTPASPPQRKRFIVIAVAVAAVMSGLALAGSGHGSAPSPGVEQGDLTSLNGRCLTLEPSRQFKEIVDCTRPHDARVVQVVDHGVACPIWSDATLAGTRQDLCLDTV